MAESDESSPSAHRPPTDHRSLGPQSSLADAFAERARAGGAQVTLVPTIEEAARTVATSEVPTTSGSYTSSSAVLAAYPGIRVALQAHGIELRMA
jgi:hypothetical protein